MKKAAALPVVVKPVEVIVTVRQMARWKEEEMVRCAQRALNYFEKAKEAAERDADDVRYRIEKHSSHGVFASMTNWTKHYGEQADKELTEHDAVYKLWEALAEVSEQLCLEEVEQTGGAR